MVSLYGYKQVSTNIMKMVTYKIEKELDYLRIKQLFDEMNIHYSVKFYADSSFPSLDNLNGFADITISKDNESLLTNLLANENIESSLVEETQSHNSYKNKSPNSKIKIYNKLLILYSLIVSILLFRFWYITKQSSDDKNFYYEWNFDGTRLELINKSNKNTVYLYFDDNYDFNYEYMRVFNNEGKIVIDGYDLNENGFFEENYYYNNNNNIIHTQYDLNNDRIMDKIIVIFGQNDTLKFVLKDINGYFEQIE